MKSIIVLFVVIVTFSSFAQSNLTKTTQQLNDVIYSSTDSEELLVWVFFTDKGKDLSHYLAKPQSVVSERSLKRRRKVLPEDKLIGNMDLPVNEQYIDELLKKGFKVKHRSKWFNGVSGYATKTEIDLMSQSSIVKEIDVVQKFKGKNPIEEEKSGNFEQGTNFKQNNVHSFNYGSSFTQVNQINVPAVHDLGFTGEGILICSMDAGFNNLSHEVFSSINIIDTWDFVNGDSNVGDEGDMGEGSHGTKTLSTIGGFKEGQLIGTAFGSDYLLAKTENTGSETPLEEDNWIAALEWADNHGVDVTTTSLGYLGMDSPFSGYTWEDMDGNTARITVAADLAVGLGIVVVNSAGNSGFNPNHNTLGAPADGDSVITVGAVIPTGDRASFSSVGPTVDGRIKPDLMAMGSSVYRASPFSQTGYGTGSGTSYSCPLLAGAVALLLEIDPSLTPIELTQLLKNTASQSSTSDNLMGWGIINTFSAAQQLLTDVEENELPENFYVLRNYPNPFNPSTTIEFAIPNRSFVRITLHNVLGEELDILINDEIASGVHQINLNADELASGVYFVALTADNFFKTIKISLLK